MFVGGVSGVGGEDVPFRSFYALEFRFYGRFVFVCFFSRRGKMKTEAGEGTAITQVGLGTCFTHVPHHYTESPSFVQTGMLLFHGIISSGAIFPTKHHSRNTNRDENAVQPSSPTLSVQTTS